MELATSPKEEGDGHDFDDNTELLPTEGRDDDCELRAEVSEQVKQQLLAVTKYIVIGVFFGLLSSFSIAMLTNPGQQHDSPVMVKNPGRQHNSPVTESTKKIFNVGLPKSGSSSINDFFKCEGRRSFHWKVGNNYIGDCVRKAISSNILIEELPDIDCSGLKSFDVLAQMDYMEAKKCFMPQVTNVDHLDRMYPNATFVLPLRPAADWAKSVIGWRDHLDKRMISCINRDKLYNMSKGATETHEFLEKFYVTHREHILKYFARRFVIYVF